MRCRAHGLSMGLLIVGGFVLMPNVNAETYVAGQLGFSVPNRASNVDVHDPAAPVNSHVGDYSLQNSLLYGAKVGHYFEPAPPFGLSLGLEAEVFNTNPNIKQQPVTVSAPIGSATFDHPGSTNRVTALAFNLLFRYPGKALQPYAGVGLGVFFAHQKDAGTGESQSSTAPGLNVLGGLRWKITEHVGVFGEYKYERVRFSFDPTPSLTGYNSTYSANSFVFGVGYHF
jgi:opacity protein-like surface antigen